MRRLRVVVESWRIVPILLVLILFSASPVRASSLELPSQDNSALTTFAPPAYVNDFPPEKEEARKKFMAIWSDNVKQWTEQAILGDPWTIHYDSPRPYYYTAHGQELRI